MGRPSQQQETCTAYNSFFFFSKPVYTSISIISKNAHSPTSSCSPPPPPPPFHHLLPRPHRRRSTHTNTRRGLDRRLLATRTNWFIRLTRRRRRQPRLLLRADQHGNHSPRLETKHAVTQDPQQGRNLPGMARDGNVGVVVVGEDVVQDGFAADVLI